MTDYTKQGWVRLYRKSIDSSIWKNPNTWFVWSWCLMKANHQTHQFPFNGTDLEVKEGQFITGINKAIEELPTLTTQKLRTILKYLKSTGRITIKSNNKYSVITITKWEDYQQDNKQTNKRTTNEQQTNNKPTTTYKNDNNDNNDKNDKIDTTSKEVNKKISISKEILESDSKEIPLLMKEFESINPSVKRMYGNKTQRQACSDLIKTYTLEKTIQVISEVLPQIKGQPFFPEISTPYELFNKWSKLESAIIRYGKEKNIKSKVAF